MSAVRLRGLSILVVVGLNALVVLAWSQTWIEARAEGRTISVSGAAGGGAVLPLALSGLVLALALLLAGPVFRVILAVLQALLGVCIAIAAGIVLLDPDASASSPVAAETGVSGSGDATTVTLSAWPVVALALGVLLVVAGIAIAATARRWPPTTRRYDRTRLAADAESDPVREWDALSEGEDPTKRSG